MTYDALAEHWNGEEFNRENGITQHEKALRFLADDQLQGGRGIDIGCGSSGRFIDLMLSKKLTVEGLDISPEMLRLAKVRHPKQTFHLADICKWEHDGKYDFITAWDSIWHAPLEEHEAILRKLCNALADTGVLIFTSGAVDEPGEVSNNCKGMPLYHAALGIPKLLEIIADCGVICRHLEFDQFPDTHLYLIVQKTS